MHTRLILALVQLASLSLACAQIPPNHFEPDKTIVYKNARNEGAKKGEQPTDKPLTLHVFLPKDWKATDKRPAAIFFFGGGWSGGSPRQFYPQCHLLAGHGMVAISADYRTKSSHGTDPRACIEDGKSAVRWLHEHAGELGIDLDKLAIGGGSAGGHVAAAAHFCKGFNAEGEDQSVPSAGDALLLYNPVLDNGPGEYGHSRVKDYWKEFSPAHNVAKLNPPAQPTPVPPTLYLLGTKDKLIPVETAKRFQKTVEEAGGRCDLKLHEGAPHGFFNRKPHLEKTNEELVEFLISLGWIKK